MKEEHRELRDNIAEVLLWIRQHVEHDKYMQLDGAFLASELGGNPDAWTAALNWLRDAELAWGWEDYYGFEDAPDAYVQLSGVNEIFAFNSEESALWRMHDDNAKLRARLNAVQEMESLRPQLVKPETIN